MSGCDAGSEVFTEERTSAGDFLYRFRLTAGQRARRRCAGIRDWKPSRFMAPMDPSELMKFDESLGKWMQLAFRARVLLTDF